MEGAKPVESGKVKVNDVNLYYELYGEGDPLVLIAGTGISCAPWRVFQVPEFSKHYQVLIYDHRGLGRSDKPDVPYTTQLFAKDCVGLMDALGIRRAHIMGHSMGARVAQWFSPGRDRGNTVISFKTIRAAFRWTPLSRSSKRVMRNTSTIIGDQGSCSQTNS